MFYSRCFFYAERVFKKNNIVEGLLIFYMSIGVEMEYES